MLLHGRPCASRLDSQWKAQSNPERAEALVWQGIVASTYAGVKGPFGAMSLANEARDALIADVAERGFEVFAKGLAEAWAEGTPEPREALLRMGRAYLAFAREEPAYYTAMFESGLSFREYPSLQEVSDRAFGVLRQACEAVIATLPAEKRPPVMMMALHIWSLTHGLAGLFARGDAARHRHRDAPVDQVHVGV